MVQTGQNPDLSLASVRGARNPDSILTLFSGDESCDDVTFRGDAGIVYVSATVAAPAVCPPAALPAATGTRHLPLFVNTTEREPAADVTAPLPTTPGAVRDGSSTMTDVEPVSPVAEAQSTGAFKRPSVLPLRSPVFGAAQRPSTSFYSEVSATRTDIRLRHGMSGVVATQSTMAMDTSTRASTLRPLASASTAGRRHAPGQQSPRSSVESWLRDTPSPKLVAPPPSRSGMSSRQSALQAALPLGADAAAVATSHHNSQHTLRSGRSSMALEVLNFMNRITDNVMQLASQIQCDATSREDKLREEAIQRENMLRDEKLKAEELAARREEKLREENLRREEILAHREHVLAQLKADSDKINADRERVQAEISSKEKQVLLETELQRHKIQAEANNLIQKERIEADVRR